MFQRLCHFMCKDCEQTIVEIVVWKLSGPIRLLLVIILFHANTS